MSCCFYVMLLQVFTNVYVSSHVHVLTCVNVPINIGHVTDQTNVTLMISYIIDHSFAYTCIILIIS